MLSDQVSQRPTVLLVGFGSTALSALESLAEQFQVLGVVREYDPLSPESDEVIRTAGNLGLPVYGEASLAALEGLIDRLKPDCVVVSSYNRVLPARIVSKCRFVNVHYSLLPRYRGRANVNWAIINGEPQTGISIHQIVPGLDAGNILFQQPVDIEPEDNATTLYDKLNSIQRQRLGATVLAHLRGDPGRLQDESQATYACTRGPADGEIDWTAPTERIHNLIRALTPPFPGAFSYLNGKPLLIWKSVIPGSVPRYVGRVPGRVSLVSKSDGFADILTGDGVLRRYR